MGQVIQVEPRPEAYVVEWRAIQFAIGDWESIKRLLRPCGAIVFVDLADNDGPVLVVVRQGLQTRLREGDWVVLSPHDKVIAIDDYIFHREFLEVS